MPEVTHVCAARRCSLDWPFFSAYSKTPQVMLYVGSPPGSGYSRRFDARLPAWSPGAAWLCLVVRDRSPIAPWGLTGYQHHAPDSAEAGFLFAPAQGKGYG